MLAGLWLLIQDYQDSKLQTKLDEIAAEQKTLQSDFAELCKRAHELASSLPSSGEWQGFSCDPEGFRSHDEDERQ